MNKNNIHNDNKSNKKKEPLEDESSQKWFSKDDFQDLAKIGSDILKKTMATGKEVFKDVKDNFPKEASQLIMKGKDEFLKGLTQEVAKNMVIFTISKFFAIAREHSLEITFRIKKNNDSTQHGNHHHNSNNEHTPHYEDKHSVKTAKKTHSEKT